MIKWMVTRTSKKINKWKKRVSVFEIFSEMDKCMDNKLYALEVWDTLYGTLSRLICNA